LLHTRGKVGKEGCGIFPLHVSDHRAASVLFTNARAAGHRSGKTGVGATVLCETSEQRPLRHQAGFLRLAVTLRSTSGLPTTPLPTSRQLYGPVSVCTGLGADRLRETLTPPPSRVRVVPHVNRTHHRPSFGQAGG
jgi:hypothetical protein